MLKEYLSEAVSLLTEAILGKPRPVQAWECYWGASCSTCGACGFGKKKYRLICYVCGTACSPGGCNWCDMGCQCGDYC